MRIVESIDLDQLAALLNDCAEVGALAAWHVAELMD